MSILHSKKSLWDIYSLDDVLQKNSSELNTINDLDGLMKDIGDAKYVLLGEASHGTHEYYTWRSQISKKLIEEKGFSFIAVEGDWPDCYRLNRYIKNYSGAGQSAYDVLHAFDRWPTWMWANWEIVALSEWLRKHNEKLSAKAKVGFYGLDVYSLWESMDAIIAYLDKKDPKTKQTALKAFRCFEPYSEEEGQSYARATKMVPYSCEDEVVNLLAEIRKNMASYNTDPESVMDAEQNARVIVNAERYYRAMVKSGSKSWNLRDNHMVETLNSLMKFYGDKAKCIIWAHNTHIGDARATDMAAEGMVNIGQLLNQEHGEEGVYSVGFGSYTGTVVAGHEWGDKMRIIQVPKAREKSWEWALHSMEARNKVFYMKKAVQERIGNLPIGHRAIGVVYNPAYEHLGNYVPSLLPLRYNAFIYLDETTALHPLHLKPKGHQMPETYPFGV